MQNFKQFVEETDNSKTRSTVSVGDNPTVTKSVSYPNSTKAMISDVNKTNFAITNHPDGDSYHVLQIKHTKDQSNTLRDIANKYGIQNIFPRESFDGEHPSIRYTDLHVYGGSNAKALTYDIHNSMPLSQLVYLSSSKPLGGGLVAHCESNTQKMHSPHVFYNQDKGVFEHIQNESNKYENSSYTNEIVDPNEYNVNHRLYTNTSSNDTTHTITLRNIKQDYTKHYYPTDDYDGMNITHKDTNTKNGSFHTFSYNTQKDHSNDTQDTEIKTNFINRLKDKYPDAEVDNYSITTPIKDHKGTHLAHVSVETPIGVKLKDLNIEKIPSKINKIRKIHM